MAVLLSKAVFLLLLLIICWLLSPLWDSVIVLCFVVRYFVSILVLQSSWWGRERAGCFALFVFLVSSGCCVNLLRGATGLSAVCECGSFWSYSLFCIYQLTIFLNISNDCTEHKHIEYIIWKMPWLRINVMHIFKFLSSRKSLKTIFMSFIRPILEYQDVVLDNGPSKINRTLNQSKLKQPE